MAHYLARIVRNRPSHFPSAFVGSGPWPTTRLFRRWSPSSEEKTDRGTRSSHPNRAHPRLRLIAISFRFLDEMADINFRKIDIDVYDEDALVETELYDADPRNPSQVVNDARQKATAVRSALSK